MKGTHADGRLNGWRMLPLNSVSSKSTDPTLSELEIQFLDAAMSGDGVVVSSYLNAGGNVDVADQRGMPWGQTALMLACERGHKEIVATLLAAKANWKLKDKAHTGEGGGDMAVHYAARGGNFEVLEMLLRKGARIDAKGSDGATVLLIAITRGNEALVHYALKSGANVEHRNKMGSTALCEAALLGHIGILRLLLGNGAVVDAPGGPFDRTALICAILGGGKNAMDAVEMLLLAGANPRYCATNGETPFEWSLHRRNALVMKLLIQAGVDVNLPVDGGWLPLDYAKRMAQAELSDQDETLLMRRKMEDIIELITVARAKGV